MGAAEALQYIIKSTLVYNDYCSDMYLVVSNPEPNLFLRLSSPWYLTPSGICHHTSASS